MELDDHATVRLPASAVPCGPEYMMAPCLRSAQALFGGWDMAELAERRLAWQRRSRWFLRLALIAAQPLHRAVRAHERAGVDVPPMLETYFHWDDALEQLLHTAAADTDTDTDGSARRHLARWHGGTAVAGVPLARTLLYVDLPPCRNYDTGTLLRHNNDPADWEGRCTAVLRFAAQQHLPTSVNRTLLELSPAVTRHTRARAEEIDLF